MAPDVKTALQQTQRKQLSQAEIAELLSTAGWSPAQIHDVVGHEEITKEAIIRIEGVAKLFRTKTILENLYVHIRKGEIFGIIGPSGSGKTTLLNLIAGYYTPDRGDVLVDHNGKTVSASKSQKLIKRLIGFSTQSPSVYAKLTVLENILHFSTLYGLSQKESINRARALIRLMGLEGSERTLAADLSGGMYKRLDIACSMTHNPLVLILDEPTADLDPLMRKSMMQLIREINKRGTTIILASHFLGEVEHLCSRIAIVRNKTIREIGTANQLKDLYTKNYIVTIRLASKSYGPLLSELRAQKIAESVDKEDTSLVIKTGNPQAALIAIATSLSRTGELLEHVHIARPSMQELFNNLVQQ